MPKKLDKRDRSGYGRKTHNGESFELITVQCPQCQTELRISEDAEWFRCLKCSHEGDAAQAEVLDG